MTLNRISTVVFDMGGTIEDVYFDDELRLQATPGFCEILARQGLNPGLCTADLYALIKTGMLSYQSWRLSSQRELAPEEIWKQFVFTNHGFAQDKLEEIGEELAFFWDTRFFKRSLRPEVPSMLAELQARGIKLGVISNTTSRTEVACKLAEYGIAHYFDAVIVSAEFGWRKPHPRIFEEATRRLQCAPAECAYVGDTVSRDIIGARRAGFALAIQIKSFLTTQSDGEKDVESPDAIIQSLMQVVDIVCRPVETKQ